MDPILQAVAALRANAEFSLLEKSIIRGAFPLSLLGASHGSSLAFALAALSERPPLIIVVAGEPEARDLAEDLALFGVEAAAFPTPKSRLYQPSQGSGERAQALLSLARGSRVTIIPIRAAMSKLAPPSYLRGRSLSIEVKRKLDPVKLAEAVADLGYIRTPRVGVPGEFASRGEVVDIFIHGEENPSRVRFDFDEPAEITLFDPENQISVASIRSLDIPPARETSFNDEESTKLERRWNNGEESKGRPLPLEAIRTGGRYDEYFLPLLFEEETSVIEYLSEGGVVLFHNEENLARLAAGFEKEAEELYKQSIRAGTVVPRPETILFNFDTLLNRSLRRISVKNFMSDTSLEAIRLHSEEARSFFGNVNFLREELAGGARNGYRSIVFAESDKQKLRVETLLEGIDNLVVTEGSLSSGFTLPGIKTAFICEHEIFGRRRRLSSAAKKIESKAIDSFIDLNPGDAVVHVNHGVGRFTGIEHLKTGGVERDYIALEYADEEMVFIPIEQVNLVQRYIGGGDGSGVRLDKIGGKSWGAKKARAQKSAEELADFLLDIYAKRQEAAGFAFPKDDTFQLEFEADFPFTETADQLQAMEEIKADMESDRPMDRLVCGDVGYGKTELAMRAAFKAAIAGKQAALLCPTTILAEQHYENFIKRFERFPFITIRLLSRFVEKRDITSALQELAAGKADIVIGTHRLLSKDIAFKNLGLLIVDEEQRFGVKDKERIKTIKTGVDCLAMTATPIPRTLHMSLVKIRDLSMLRTPPKNRRPVETLVNEYDPVGVAAAIRREMERGGQIFYLHNRVESLDATAAYVANLVPEAMVESAHGRMAAEEIDDVMRRFVTGAFQVLVSTTIIESGIDIPNVNTIIIDRADMYGVSQLYQLRGRVGRSDRVAYAYLFYPERSALSEQAMKRLQIISDFTELGSGFKIAMKDMEVRGAGDLLGREQSGQITAVGFDLYLRLLDDAVKARTHKGEADAEPYIELEYSGFIPDSYVSDTMEKMEIYKKIASVADEEEAASLYTELMDRFGPLTDEVSSLLGLSEIRALCKRLRIKSFKEHKGRATVEFTKLADLSIDKLMRLVKESSGRIKPDPRNPALLIIETGSVGLREKSEFLRDRLARLI